MSSDLSVWKRYFHYIFGIISILYDKPTEKRFFRWVSGKECHNCFSKHTILKLVFPSKKHMPFFTSGFECKAGFLYLFWTNRSSSSSSSVTLPLSDQSVGRGWDGQADGNWWDTSGPFPFPAGGEDVITQGLWGKRRDKQALQRIQSQRSSCLRSTSLLLYLTYCVWRHLEGIFFKQREKYLKNLICYLSVTLILIPCFNIAPFLLEYYH